jgi:DNA transformation protein
VGESTFKDYVLDQLAPLGAVACRGMFGGYGFYHEGIFFGLVYKERLYLRTDAHNRAEYLARGMRPFRPNARQTLTSYYEVPADVIESAARLARWARRAALRAPVGPRRRRPKRRIASPVRTGDRRGAP